MTAPDLADADPVAVLLDWFKNHPAAVALLGGSDHFSGLLEDPWPHVVLSDGPGGSMRDLVWEGEFEVMVEVYGDPMGSPGQAALRKIGIRLAKIATDLPEHQQVTATTPVVSRVRSSGVAAFQPLANGQDRFTIGLLLTIRPPLALP